MFRRFCKWLFAMGYRVTGWFPADRYSCEWCREVKHTTLEEVWSIAYPKGRLVRLCKDCRSCCAGE